MVFPTFFNLSLNLAMRMYRTVFWTLGRGRWWDNLGEWHWNMYIICETYRQSRFDAWDRVLRAGALGWPRGMGWRGRWEAGSRWGTHVHVHPWQIHVNVWQPPRPKKKGVRELCLWMVELDLKFRPQTHLLYLKSGLCSYITQLPEDFCKTYCVFSKRCLNWRRKCIPV